MQLKLHFALFFVSALRVFFTLFPLCHTSNGLKM